MSFIFLEMNLYSCIVFFRKRSIISGHEMHVTVTTATAYLFESIHSSIKVFRLQHAQYDIKPQTVDLLDIIGRKPQTDELHCRQHVADTCRFLYAHHQKHNVSTNALLK